VVRVTRTLILVDGSASSLFYWGMLLKRLDYKVVTLRSHDEALRQMEMAMPAAVLVGSVLSGARGIDLIRKMKSMPSLRDVPAIMLSDREDRQEQDDCRRLGCTGWFSRDVEPDVLYRTIQSATESAPRTYIRLATSLKVVVGDGTSAGGGERTESATALSEGGLFVRTRYPQPRNALTPIRIDLDGAMVRAKAIVLYSSAQGDGPTGEPGMGMKFVDISDRDRGLIRTYIKKQLVKDIAP
jgi:CheY-like chemotaxis protein